MAQKGQQVNIHELRPAKTIAQAVSNAKAHVNAVNQSAGSSGSGSTGGGRGRGQDKK